MENEQLKHECSKCGSKPGQPCTNYLGHRKQPCRARGQEKVTVRRKPKPRELKQGDLFDGLAKGEKDEA